jgi:hypothetical protein
MAIENLVEFEMSPEPQRQPNVAELPRIGPAYRFQVDPDDVRIVRRTNLVVVGEEAELPIFILQVVELDCALPASLLIVVELPEVGDDALSRTGVGAKALHEGVVEVSLAVFGSPIASKEHGGLRVHR